MSKGFILHIKDFGKIEAADINIAPATFFIGDNNSGKSYVMSLIYALLNVRFYREGFDLCVKSEEYQWCSNWIKQGFSDDSKYALLTNDVQNRFQALLNLILKNNRKKITQTAFNSPVNLGEISIEFYPKDNISITFQELKDASAAEEQTRRRIRISFGDGRNQGFTTSAQFDNRFFISSLLEALLKRDLDLSFRAGSIFLPTSRTGFLLTYKSLLRATIADAYDIQEEVSGETKHIATQLTRPCTDFLKNLASISAEAESNKFQSIIDFIEKEMISGHISISQETPQAMIRYSPANTDSELPMHLSSGVVTELTPLLLMLKYHSDMKVLFIEEPEMGLHPGLQLEMARVLLQIHAAGTPIFVTTHSDTILQHVNNMLNLHALNAELQSEIQQELGYTQGDMLEPEDVQMYQFDVNTVTQKSTVTKLEQGSNGFVIPSFNNALKKLLYISRKMEIDDDDV